MENALLLPVAALAFWTLAVLALVPLMRIRATRDGRTHVKDYRYGESTNVPGDVALANRDYMNLLELPVLFYVVALALVATKRVDDTYILLAWAFVVARIAHSLVHLTYNNVLHRLAVFSIAATVLIVMWVRFALTLT